MVLLITPNGGGTVYAKPNRVLCRASWKTSKSVDFYVQATEISTSPLLLVL